MHELDCNHIYLDLRTQKLLIALAISPSTIIWRYLGSQLHEAEDPTSFRGHTTVHLGPSAHEAATLI